MDVKNANETIIDKVDSVHLIKDLKAKGSWLVLKKEQVDQKYQVYW